jgi:hypothetical protein
MFIGSNESFLTLGTPACDSKPTRPDQLKSMRVVARLKDLQALEAHVAQRTNLPSCNKT